MGQHRKPHSPASPCSDTSQTHRSTPQHLVGRGRARARLGVALGDRSYDIELGHDWLETIGRRAAKRLAADRLALVTVPTVARRYAPMLTRGLEAGGGGGRCG